MPPRDLRAPPRTSHAPAGALLATWLVPSLLARRPPPGGRVASLPQPLPSSPRSCWGPAGPRFSPRRCQADELAAGLVQAPVGLARRHHSGPHLLCHLHHTCCQVTGTGLPKRPRRWVFLVIMLFALDFSLKFCNMAKISGQGTLQR